jgi:predicted nucleotidyltransferase/DNA-binding XRE family transcriptional regulator
VVSGSTSGGLLRTARERAGLTQMELARRSGVTQSVISAYESGHRQPALPTLAALIDAAGFDLDVRLRRVPRQLDRLSGPLGLRVRRHRHELVRAAAAHGVTNLRVFGSVARGEDQPGSDVDLLADIPAGLGLLGLGRVSADLEQILNTQVDLVPAGDLKPQVARRVADDLVAL